MDGGILKNDPSAPIEKRLYELHRDLAHIIETNEPHVMAVENLYSHYKHPRTSIIMGHGAGGDFSSPHRRADVPVVSYAATEIKKSLVGAGRRHEVAGAATWSGNDSDCTICPNPPTWPMPSPAAYCHIDRSHLRSDQAIGSNA